MKNLLLPIIVFLFFSTLLHAEIVLPKVVSSHMVLQRNTPVKIWGTADIRENVIVSFNGQTIKTRANKNGNWQVVLSSMQAGGPFNMLIKGKNTIELTNILIGDVWICSGQSNMEMSVKLSHNAEEEIAVANYPMIRLFTVPRTISSTPKSNISGGSWLECSSENIAEFSAVAYYFARKLQKEINVPIGLVHSSWGGTGVETWTSEEGLSSQEGFKSALENLKNFNPETYANTRKKKLLDITGPLPNEDVGLVGEDAIWAQSSHDFLSWKTMNLPQLWENAGLIDLDGIVWFQTDFELDEDEAKNTISIHLGRIDDSDNTYLNGIKVGGMVEKYDVDRIYPVESGTASIGKNVLVVRVEDLRFGGGFSSPKADLYIKTTKRKIPLAGLWKYRIGKGIIAARNAGNPNAMPSLLYNGMIHPLLPMTIKGAIWYQGEHNASRAYEYRKLFPNMITDWRKQFNQGNFPFLYVQLANFMKADDEPVDSNWAELREAQSLTLKNTPNTGMAVIIDVGEANDIHPKNKQDVGKRLATEALKKVYHKEHTSSPAFLAMKIVNDTVRIVFKEVGHGLKVKNRYGYVNGFTIAGVDKKFYWAKAYIEKNNTIVVISDAVTEPVAVRYAWANNPDDVNLYNSETLPADPFRTDDWPGITIDNGIEY